MYNHFMLLISNKYISFDSKYDIVFSFTPMNYQRKVLLGSITHLKFSLEVVKGAANLNIYYSTFIKFYIPKFS